MKTYEEIMEYHNRAAADLKAPNCDETYDDSDLVKESIVYHELVAEACEKQVAKKPSEKHPFKSFGSCPECGINISTRTDKNHCGNCGQKIDWSEE